MTYRCQEMELPTKINPKESLKIKRRNAIFARKSIFHRSSLIEHKNSTKEEKSIQNRDECEWVSLHFKVRRLNFPHFKSTKLSCYLVFMLSVIFHHLIVLLYS